MPKFTHPIGIGQEANVRNVIRIQGQPVLEPEGHDRHLQIGGRFIGNQVPNPAREIVHGEFGCIDDGICPRLQTLELTAFLVDAVQKAAIALQWVRPANRFETPHKFVVVTI